MREQVGKLVDLGNDIGRVLAPNPSPMTFHGTNSFLIGKESVAIVDPGPDDKVHMENLIAAIAGRPVSHVIVTHSHLDHSPLAARLADHVGAPVLAFGDSYSGRSETMQKLAEEGLAGGGEGVDHLFVPDQLVADGDILKGDDWQAEVIYTPGHFGNHICLKIHDTLISGDIVMGWSSTLVSPPDGDLRAFLTSCQRLLDINAKRHLPAHGEPIEKPNDRLNWLIAHRASREVQVVEALRRGSQTVQEIATSIYTDIDARLIPMAERNVFAHLIDLVERNIASATPVLSVSSRFRLNG